MWRIARHDFRESEVIAYQMLYLTFPVFYYIVPLSNKTLWRVKNIKHGLHDVSSSDLLVVFLWLPEGKKKCENKQEKEVNIFFWRANDGASSSNCVRCVRWVWTYLLWRDTCWWGGRWEWSPPTQRWSQRSATDISPSSSSSSTAQLRGETQITQLLLLFSYSRTIGKTSIHHFLFLTQSPGYFCIYFSEPNWLFKISRDFSLSSQEPLKCVWTVFKWTVYYSSLLSLICMNRMTLKLFSQFIRALHVHTVKLLPAMSQRINTKYN